MSELSLKDLYAQPIGAIVVDRAEIAFQLSTPDAWYMTGSEAPIPSVALMEQAPLHLVWTPGTAS